MSPVKKIFQKLTNPILYRKMTRNLAGRFRSFEHHSGTNSLDQFPSLATVLVILAHPDDETFCSGLICELKERGSHLTILCLTRGEGGPRAGHPREDLGVIRSGEMERACEVLGVDELIFLGHTDPLWRGFRGYAPDVSVKDLATQIRPYLDGVDLVISHGSSGEYWHPGHLLVFDSVKEVFKSIRGRPPAWMTFLARQTGFPLPEVVNWNDPAFLTIDGARHQELRERAIECHRTQLAVFGKFAGGDYRDFIRLTAREVYALQKRGDLQIPEAADKGKREGNHRAHTRGEGTQREAEWLRG